MFSIKFTVTYSQKNDTSYEILFYTVGDKEGNLLDVKKESILKRIDIISNASKNDIENNKIIGEHVKIVGNKKQFTPNCVRSVIYGYNDFETWCLKHNKTLLNEYRGSINPRNISYGQYIDVDWKCSKCGADFKSIIKNRTGKGYGCKICSKQGDSFPQYYVYMHIHKIYNDTVYKYNYIENDNRYEVDMFIPGKMLAIEYDGIAWHNSDASIKRDKTKEDYLKSIGIDLLRIKESDTNTIDYTNRIIYCIRDIKCENIFRLLKVYIKNKFGDDLIKIDYTDLVSEYSNKKPNISLSSAFPNIARYWNTELNKISADYISPKSTRYGFFTCDKCKVTLSRKILNVTGRGDVFKCPVCNGKIIVPGVNDLYTNRPDLMRIWDWKINNINEINPHLISVTSHKECAWKCDNCGHSWMMTLPSIKNKKYCNKCGKLIKDL